MRPTTAGKPIYDLWWGTRRYSPVPAPVQRRRTRFGRPNVYGLSRAVPTRGSSATQRVALPEPARPAGRRAAPRRLLTGVGRSRTSDMGFVAVLKQEFAAKRQRTQTDDCVGRAVQITLMK